MGARISLGYVLTVELLGSYIGLSSTIIDTIELFSKVFAAVYASYQCMKVNIAPHLCQYSVYSFWWVDYVISLCI